MGLKPLVGSIKNMNKRIDLQNDEVETEGEISKEDDHGENSSGVNKINDCGSEKAQKDGEPGIKFPGAKLTD